MFLPFRRRRQTFSWHCVASQTQSMLFMLDFELTSFRHQFFLHPCSEKDSGRGGKNYVLMCNKLLDDAFHCHSNVCVRWCFVRSSTRIHCNAHIVIVISPSLAHSHTFPKRVDFKFIFICLDLSLELFFIPLTISSVRIQMMEANA